MKNIFKIHKTGLIDYQKCWDIQKQLFDHVLQNKLQGKEESINHLILCEHPHVYTIGKNGNLSNLLVQENFLEQIQAKVYHIDRGGDITYHGPGQIVGYPIMNLEKAKIKIKDYIFLLEETIIKTLAYFGIEAGRIESATGVWYNDKVLGKKNKLCAIGVKTSHWVTMHGFALNVNTNLDYFSYINPCGFTDKGVCSMKTLLGNEIDIQTVINEILRNFEDCFQASFLPVEAFDNE